MLRKYVKILAEEELEVLEETETETLWIRKVRASQNSIDQNKKMSEKREEVLILEETLEAYEEIEQYLNGLEGLEG